MSASGSWQYAADKSVKWSCFKAEWAVTWMLHEHGTPCKRINDSIYWALGIPGANESRPESQETGPLGNAETGISRSLLQSLASECMETQRTPHPLPPALAHCLPSGCLFSVTQLGWILLKIWCLQRTLRCLGRLPVIINTTAGNNVVVGESPWSSTHSLWCFCSKFPAQSKRYTIFKKVIIIKKTPSLTF